MTEVIVKMVKTAKTTILTKFVLIQTALKKIVLLDTLILANLDKDAFSTRKRSAVSHMFLLSVTIDLNTWGKKYKF